MSLELNSPCKVNLLLNILGRRADGFHELETVLHPLPLYDRLAFEKGGTSVQLTCSEPSLAVDRSNLVYRAAVAFLDAAGVRDGVRIHLIKRVPVAAGLGGGSANAAVTLLGLNQLFGEPVALKVLNEIAATLGSDVPFFLQDGPAIAVGHGEHIEPVRPFESLRGAAVLLVRPGFGVSTAWAYRALSNHPECLNGKPGSAAELVERLHSGPLAAAGALCFNSLEPPVFKKYPLLALLKEFLVEQDTVVTLLSGSGSTTFAIMSSGASAETLREKVLSRFGAATWTAIANL